MRSILFILIFIYAVVAIFLYVIRQDISIIILVILAILLFHTVYLEVIDSEIEKIIKKFEEK
jgi:hypothetical protein